MIYVPIDQLKGRTQSTPSRVAKERFGVEGVCEPSLEALGTRIVLKRTKRAYGVVTCLGVK
ncbi:cobalamin biosynthesis protein [Metallosphaera hakonensis]|uniref:cobalamin biosynthesis protein n=1 Tax=Metallosphaera hakonensis TaxID=79601 RepID=UPI002092D7D8|nr:cobalamin biosynthesis protein [Metallosphaera hakonensis]